MNRRTVLRLAGGLTAGALARGAAATAVARQTPSTEEPPTNGSTGTPTNTSGFTPLASLPLPDAREAVVGPDGTTVYVATMDGFAVVDVSDPATPTLLAERRDLLPDADGGPLGQIQEVAVDGDQLLVVGPAHPDADAVKAAILYDVSEPTEPSQLAVHPTDNPIHNGELRDGLAYLTATDWESNPIEIVDFRETPVVVGRWSPVDEDPAWAAVPTQLRPSHDVIVRDGVAYCSFWDAGTWLVDVRDPTDPRAIRRVGGQAAETLASEDVSTVEGNELPGNHHSTSLDDSGRLLAIGHEAWDADGDGEGGPGGIDLVDVSTPETPEMLGSVAPPPTADPTLVGEWATAHNFELRDGFLYSAWYQGGVRIHDVTDPAEPREVAAWRHPETTRFWTAQVADGAVVAPSMGTEGSDPGLYTFPLPDDVPRTTATDSTGANTAGGVPPAALTATPGTAVTGAAATALGGGLAWLLVRRRRR